MTRKRLFPRIGPVTTRAQRLAALGKQSHDKTNQENKKDAGPRKDSAESPCPLLANDPEFVEFSTIFESCKKPVTPLGLRNEPAGSDNSLLSPPKKLPKQNVSGLHPSQARRSLELGSGLALIHQYDSDSSQGCFPECNIPETDVNNNNDNINTPVSKGTTVHTDPPDETETLDRSSFSSVSFDIGQPSLPLTDGKNDGVCVSMEATVAPTKPSLNVECNIPETDVNNNNDNINTPVSKGTTVHTDPPDETETLDRSSFSSVSFDIGQPSLPLTDGKNDGVCVSMEATVAPTKPSLNVECNIPETDVNNNSDNINTPVSKGATVNTDPPDETETLDRSSFSSVSFDIDQPSLPLTDGKNDGVCVSMEATVAPTKPSLNVVSDSLEMGLDVSQLLNGFSFSASAVNESDLLTVLDIDGSENVLPTESNGNAAISTDSNNSASLNNHSPDLLLSSSGDLPSDTVHVEFAVAGDAEHCEEVLAAVDPALGDALVFPFDNTNELEVQVVDTVDEEVETEPPAVEPEDEAFPTARTRNKLKWKKIVVKSKKDAGLAHISLRGKVRESKKMGEGCTTTCKRMCHHHFEESHRLSIFSNFYGIQDHTMQWNYIGNCVRSVEIKRRTVSINHGEKPRKNFTHTYFLPMKNGSERQVCLKFFLGTLAITERWVRTAIEKRQKNVGVIPKDGRGKSAKVSVVKTLIRQDIIDHIKKFKTIEGHYTRKDCKARYLPEHLNRRKMHALYLMEKGAQAVTTNIAKLRHYRNVFKEFNLKFFKPKKDQCNRCLSWKNKTVSERTPEALAKYEKHLSDKEISQTLKTEDIELVKAGPESRPESKDVCVATCDLEKVFLCPKGENGEFFYKSKLSVYNFTIFISGDQLGMCFVWDQTEAGRGSAEIASCLWFFLKMKAAQGVKEVRLYTDNCTGQNKNQFLFSLYVMASIRLGIKIVHRYLEVGHTHMECDSVHATIQTSIKVKDIFLPSEWYTAIKLAKKIAPKYTVIEMKQEEIFNFAPLAAYLSWDKLRTSEFKEVSFNGNHPGEVRFKTEYAGEEKVASVLKKSRGRPVNWNTVPLERRYTAKIPLRPIELRDLQALCRSGAIPSKYHPYYMETLPAIDQEFVVPPPEVPFDDPDTSGPDTSDCSSDGESESEDDGDDPSDLE